MKRLANKPTGKILSILFFLFVVFLLLFMERFSSGSQQNFTVFWLLILGIFATAIFQIHILDSEDKLTESLILFEIVSIVLIFGLFRIMLLNQLLPGADDAYSTLTSMSYIRDNRDFLTGDSVISRWPGLQLLGVVTSLFGIQFFDIALVSPIFFKILAVVFIYLLARALYDSRTALLAGLIFSPFYQLWSLNSRFRPELLAYVFFFACIFIYMKWEKKSNLLEATLLTILLVFSITITHYTTDVMAVFFFFVMLLASSLQTFFKLRPRPATWSSLNITLLAAVMLFGYWMYIGQPFFAFLVGSLKEAFMTELSAVYLQIGYTPGISTLKEVIITRANYFYILLFAVLMMYEVFRKRSCQNWQIDFWLTCWAGFTALVVLILERNPWVLSTSRIFLFSYPFLLIVVSHIINKVKSIGRRALFNILLVGFVILNIYSLEIAPLNPFSSVSYPKAIGDGTQEVRATNWLQSSDLIVAVDMSLVPIFNYLRQGSSINFSIQRHISLFENNMSGLKACSWLYLRTDKPQFIRSKGGIYTYVELDKELLSTISNTPWLPKVYDNGEWEIYQVSSQK